MSALEPHMQEYLRACQGVLCGVLFALSLEAGAAGRASPLAAQRSQSQSHENKLLTHGAAATPNW